MKNIPKGWKLVPEHATKTMEAAALAGVQGLHGISDRDWLSKMPGDLFRLAWPHMLAAVEPFILPTDPSPSSQVGGQDQEFIEGVAIHLHSRDADNDTLKWAKQPGKYRASLRRDVRDVLASLSELGFSIVKSSLATKEASDV